jgi:hypothetical protein
MSLSPCPCVDKRTMRSLLKRSILKPTEFKRFPIWLTIAIIALVAAASVWLRTGGGSGLSPEALQACRATALNETGTR